MMLEKRICVGILASALHKIAVAQPLSVIRIYLWKKICCFKAGLFYRIPKGMLKTVETLVLISVWAVSALSICPLIPAVWNDRLDIPWIWWRIQKILFLDEPTVKWMLQSHVILRCEVLEKNQNDFGVTILLTTHYRKLISSVIPSALWRMAGKHTGDPRTRLPAAFFTAAKFDKSATTLKQRQRKEGMWRILKEQMSRKSFYVRWKATPQFIPDPAKR